MGHLSLPCAIDGVTSGAHFTGGCKSPENTALVVKNQYVSMARPPAILVLAVIGDAWRFGSAKQVLKMAGFDLSAERSGKIVVAPNRLP